MDDIYNSNSYDVVIIGGGPAGLTAGIYVARAGLRVAIVERQYAGGQIAMTSELENYPGFISISGADIAFKMLEQAERQGVVMIYAEVAGCDFTGDSQDHLKSIHLTNGDTLSAKAIILCSGANARKLNVTNEDKFTGRGVSYCATCDGAFYKGKTVAVVGGGNTAVGDALYLAKFAKIVYLIHRRSEFRANKVMLDKLNVENIELVTDTVVESINGTNKVENIALRNVINNREFTLNVDGVFVAIGQLPESANYAKDIMRDSSGYIITDEDMRTNIDGVFSAGDVRVKRIRQVVTACGDGAIAGEMASLYVTLLPK